MNHDPGERSAPAFPVTGSHPSIGRELKLNEGLGFQIREAIAPQDIVPLLQAGNARTLSAQ